MVDKLLLFNADIIYPFVNNDIEMFKSRVDELLDDDIKQIMNKSFYESQYIFSKKQKIAIIVSADLKKACCSSYPFSSAIRLTAT